MVGSPVLAGAMDTGRERHVITLTEKTPDPTYELLYSSHKVQWEGEF